MSGFPGEAGLRRRGACRRSLARTRRAPALARLPNVSETYDAASQFIASDASIADPMSDASREWTQAQPFECSECALEIPRREHRGLDEADMNASRILRACCIERQPEEAQAHPRRG